MGNGSMKSKRLKQSDSSTIASNGRAPREAAGELEALRAKVAELERDGKRKDLELGSREQRIRTLQEQLARETWLLAELSDELQAKCVQLNRLQESMRAQAAAPGGHEGPGHTPHASPKGTPNSREGAKAGVSAEPTSSCLVKFSFEKARVPKDTSVKKLLSDALNKNQYLRRLEPQQLKDMVECMYERTYQAREYVTKQGEPGNHLFVLADGKLDVFQHNKLLTSIAVWTTFGELAILYNCTRTASVRAVSTVRTWALDRVVFQNIMRRTAETRSEQYRFFLRSVSLLANLPEEKLSRIVDCIEVEYYDKGEYVIREGEEGSTFYIIAKGKVKVTQSTGVSSLPQTINTLHTGDYFGEKALIRDDVRSANILADEDGVECLVIDRETFDQTVGTFHELQKYLEGYVATLDRDDKKRKSMSRHRSQPLSPDLNPPLSPDLNLPLSPDLNQPLSPDLIQPLSPDLIQLREKVSAFSASMPFVNLEIITTLGVGGFGRVELVRVKDEDVTFALKVMKKRHIVDNRQEEHVHSERKILAECCTPFIVKLYRTFKDDKYVYMLLEACLGGEVWSLLRDRGSFDDSTTRFCVGCVTEAFAYLHRRRVVYRDLKPENLMLDAEGYVKLVDFGFAKKITCGQKTWTFCGTPEYVAPEIILNKGHNHSVDFWSLGILVFELLTGSPPFSGSDQMMTYTFILKGIEKMDFPKKITKRPEDLIRKLCRLNPAERLGNMKNGITDVKKHRWFNGFNWEGLRAQTLPSPLKRELQGPTDHSYFDSYPLDEDSPPAETSGWDVDF